MDQKSIIFISLRVSKIISNAWWYMHATPTGIHNSATGSYSNSWWKYFSSRDPDLASQPCQSSLRRQSGKLYKMNVVLKELRN